VLSTLPAVKTGCTGVHPLLLLCEGGWIVVLFLHSLSLSLVRIFLRRAAFLRLMTPSRDVLPRKKIRGFMT